MDPSINGLARMDRDSRCRRYCVQGLSRNKLFGYGDKNSYTNSLYHQKFYQDLFPSWIWKAPTEEYPEEKLAMFSFDGISSKFAPFFLYSCVEYATDSVRQIGLSGGIVPVTAECKSNDLARGVGVTVYHLVENIEAVRLLIFTMGAWLIKT